MKNTRTRIPPRSRRRRPRNPLKIEDEDENEEEDEPNPGVFHTGSSARFTVSHDGTLGSVFKIKLRGQRPLVAKRLDCGRLQRRF